VFLVLRGTTFISQHCWAQHVAIVWPPCCDMLGVVRSSFKMVQFGPTTPNMCKYIATRWPNAHNMLHPTMLRYVALARYRTQHVAPNNVAICCVGMLQSFGRDFSVHLSVDDFFGQKLQWVMLGIVCFVISYSQLLVYLEDGTADFPDLADVTPFTSEPLDSYSVILSCT